MYVPWQQMTYMFDLWAKDKHTYISSFDSG